MFAAGPVITLSIYHLGTMIFVQNDSLSLNKKNNMMYDAPFPKAPITMSVVIISGKGMGVPSFEITK